ncbi:restriction endonuclease subunit S [Patescibacteria group bacterium]|nr:restriction endonuclease subunit S [Patescibacteria group bacterium]MBU4579574.1 restriction endonuclease subunit S [Patescibacteria group bacterium]
MITYSIIQKSQLEGAKRLDAEYYQLEFLINSKKLDSVGFDELQKLSEIDITKGETPLWWGDDYLETGVPFLRSENLVSGGLDLLNIVFISEKVNERMERSKVYPNDVLIAIVGATIGQIGLVTGEYSQYNLNQAIAIVRPQNIKYSHYLSVILETKICQLQIERLKGGGARDNLDLHEVKVIRIPRAKNQLLNYCDNVISEVKKFRDQSKSFYQQVENLLLEELKISEKDLDNQLNCIINLSDAKTANRFDAEYFEPKYQKITEHIKKNFKWSLLGDLASVKKGFEPGAESYREDGKQFIRVSSLSKYEISDSEQKCLSEELYNKLKADYQPQKGEILLTKDASPGIAYVLKENIEGIISSGILRLMLKSDKIEDEYLALCLNSIIGIMQAQRDAGGSVIMHWKPEEIKNVIIPILPKPIQQKISSLVRHAFQSRVKAKALLEEAKKRVEEMIERGGE